METKAAVLLKLVLRDVNNKRFVKKNSEEIIGYVCSCMLQKWLVFPSSLLTFLSLSSFDPVIGSSGCGTFSGLTAGVHRVRAIARERSSGQGGKDSHRSFSTLI